ncbi:MAG TPA: lysophospholipid acyltransferase family protein [Verrucomicrobiae bacterium]|nr:lysophospholipid acyltransferase family protein [Verrucomicrobiae bacterium]
MNTPPEIPLRKRARFRLEVLAVRSLAWVVPKLSRRAIWRLGRSIGWIGYYLLPKQRRIALANLDLAFGASQADSEKQKIARASSQNFATTMLSHFWAPRLTREQLDKFVEVETEGFHRVQELRAQGRPIIFITLHFGDWELLGLATGFYGLKITVVTKTMRNTGLERIFNPLRALSGHDIISSRHAGVKLLKTLERGECIALLIDQHVSLSAGGIWCDLFGVPVLTTSLIARLALRSGAAIVGGVSYPLANGRSRIVYGPEIPVQRTGDNNADVQKITQLCLQFCETKIRERPELWLWSYKRWKARPQKEFGRYPFYSRPAPRPVRPG